MLLGGWDAIPTLSSLVKKIPMISASLPNDAGITANPYFVVLNTTLQGHIEGIYKMMQKNYAPNRIIVFRKSGQQEDAIKSHFWNWREQLLLFL